MPGVYSLFKPNETLKIKQNAFTLLLIKRRYFLGYQVDSALKGVHYIRAILRETQSWLISLKPFTEL